MKTSWLGTSSSAFVVRLITTSALGLQTGCVNLNCWGWSRTLLLPRASADWSQAIPTDSVIHRQGSLTPPLHFPLYSTEQTYLLLSITAVLIYFPLSLSLCLVGVCSLKIYFFPLAGGFRETRLIFCTWDLSLCISQTLDVLMNKNKSVENLGN